MKHKILFSALASLIILLVLSACGGSPETASSPEGNPESSAAESPSGEESSEAGSRPGIGEDFQDALPMSSQLGFGTFLLEGSENAIDPEQAAELLPLWKAARSLSESETVAGAELEAIFNQIEDSMTSKQIDFISDLRLTGEEMAQLMEDLGLEFSFGGPGFSNLTPEQQATAQAARESGEGSRGGNLPGGGIPGSGNPGGQRPGGQDFGGGNLSPEQIEARRAERG
jgi:hypothetical protein